MNAFSKPLKTITSREFNQNRAKVKREAKKAPLVVTERGVPSLVVMSIQDFDTMKDLADAPKSQPAKPFRSLADALADMRPEADFDFQVPEFNGVFKGFEFE